MRNTAIIKIAPENFAHLGQNLKITLRSIKDLIPYKTNARMHSEKQIRQLARSIAEFGFTNPILVDSNNNVIAGHGRIEAAKLLELAELPVIEIGHLSEAKRRAYIIADNRLAETAGWDKDLLALELNYIHT